MLKAAGGIHTHTKVHTLQASETVIIRGKAGSIQLDAQGVTITGNILLKGNVSVTGGHPKRSPRWKRRLMKGYRWRKIAEQKR